jgi:protein-tyrosine phosphatase
MELVAGEKIAALDHIIDNLFLGDIESVKSHHVEKYQIKSIINISNSRYETLPNITYYNYDIEDESCEDISQYFSSFTSIVNSANHNVLVHCQNSVSRSVTLVLSYLLNEKSLKDSIIHLKNMRNQYTRPNLGFMKQLIKYEYKIRGSNSITFGEFIQLCR